MFLRLVNYGFIFIQLLLFHKNKKHFTAYTERILKSWEIFYHPRSKWVDIITHMFHISKQFTLTYEYFKLLNFIVPVKTFPNTTFYLIVMQNRKIVQTIQISKLPIYVNYQTIKVNSLVVCRLSKININLCAI